MLKTLIILIAGLIQSSCALAFDWQDLWLTPDQQGQKLMDKGDYQQAATRFTSPERIGTALYLAGEFEQAVSVLGRADTSDAHYNRGNAHIMLGQYDAAIAAYQRALSRTSRLARCRAESRDRTTQEAVPGATGGRFWRYGWNA